jgi:vitamin B12 transporter
MRLHPVSNSVKKTLYVDDCLRRIIFQKLFFVLLTLLCLSRVPVYAVDDSTEDLYFTETSKKSVSPTTSLLRPISKIAENITVITAADISRINAHTLSDVLQTIPGIQLDYLRTPSTNSFFNIQGALNTTVLVLIDGIRQNDFGQNIAHSGLIPVQQIERIEIIKGAASAAWGPALGGVINIITKSPNPDKAVSGMVSGSTGSQFTADSRAELSGTLDRFGYYLSAGHLRSDGLSPNTATEMNNLYGKFSYLLPAKARATFGLSYLTARPGADEGDTPNWGFVHDNNQFRRTNAFLKYNQPIGERLSLDIDGYLTNRDDHAKYGGRDNQGAVIFFNDFTERDTSRGLNTRLTWGDGQRNLVTGFEYAHAQSKTIDLLSGSPPTFDRVWDRWSFYSNGAYTFGQLTLLPGIRYDITGLAGNNFSYTLGATYQLGEKTTLRGYAAEGYTLASTNQSKGIQKVRTVQGGVETGSVPYIWLKGTYFYNTLRNSQSSGVVTLITNQDRQGFEVEARTTPLYGFSLASGYTYLFAKNADTGERLQTDSSQSVPPHLVKLALSYDNTELGLLGTLTGNYVWWNAPVGGSASDRGIIWNLHLNWKLRRTYHGLTPELFFSGHNLFNGVQTTETILFKNVPRWLEGGMRLRF